MSDAPAAAVEAAQPAEAVEAPVAPAAVEVKQEVKTEEAEAPAIETVAEAEKPAEDAPAAAEPAAEAPAEADKTTGDKSEQAKNAKSNSKFDASVLPESEDHTAIQTQVHFYFSDSNLPTDKFLWELTGGAENKPVELKKICNFGRMRRFKSYETVVAALRESKFLNVSGEAGAELVTRKNAYNPDRPRSKIDAATVYVKGFGDEEPTTQFDLEAFFSEFGTVNAVRLRRTGDNLFKGSVFVEFQDPEKAEAFLKLDPAPKWKDQELKIMSKPAYVAEKSQLIREGKIEPNVNSAPRFYEGRVLGGNRGRGGFRGRGGNANGKFDKNDWNKRRDDDRKGGFRGGRGRGGRGGGRGGNWNNNNNNNNKNRNDRNAERNGQQAGGKPVIQATNEKGQAVEGSKRGREDDGSSAAPPAKKVDVKAEAAA